MENADRLKLLVEELRKAVIEAELNRGRSEASPRPPSGRAPRPLR